LASSSVHPTSIIETGAVIGQGVNIGPYCYVGPNVSLGDGVKLVSHVSLAGRMRIGNGVTVYPFASLGHPPQDLKFAGENSETIIGDNTVVREYVTVQPGTKDGIMMTKVGKNCLLMASCHVAHDCIVGDNVILANNATLGGHVTVGDNAFVGGLAAVHQKVRIGEGAFIGGAVGIGKDVIPFGIVMAEGGNLGGLNLIGLRRRGFSHDVINQLKLIYENVLAGDKHIPISERIRAAYATEGLSEHALAVLDFVSSADSKRSLCLPE